MSPSRNCGQGAGMVWMRGTSRRREGISIYLSQLSIYMCVCTYKHMSTLYIYIDREDIIYLIAWYDALHVQQGCIGAATSESSLTLCIDM